MYKVPFKDQYTSGYAKKISGSLIHLCQDSLYVSTRVSVHHVYCWKHEVYWCCVEGRYTDSYTCGGISYSSLHMSALFMCTA